MKLTRLCLYLNRARMGTSFHRVLLKSFLLSFGVNVLLFVLRRTNFVNHLELACADEGTTICEWNAAKGNIMHKNTIAGKTKERIVVRIKTVTSEDTVTVTSDDAVLAGENFDKKAFVTIGIPSIEREGRNYLITTLDSLLHNVSNAKDFSMKIVILLADLKKSVRQKRLNELSTRYSKYFANGDIHVISVPPKVYPPLHGLTKTLGDSELRMFWRSKQAIDFAFLMQYCQPFSPYYLQLEDDVIATRDYDVYMTRYMKEKEGTFWLSLSFSSLGFIGKLYRSETLENQARFFRVLYSEMPVDLLMSLYRNILGNEAAKTTYLRHLFEHIGYQSSSLSR
ncbi:alpha-1,3-mannosyl-glycoprotein 4-beta-N-acetylglucosaminyltransferase C-like [Dendronephthya gigantea]|uniref:alpha-1,3-mannosyl-glycoprotein 4-beta-N-acetylglucosaminyltransferase C-like n=1 Tax=Dendronephthya gigantea TaxID=151771 RepID=UPI00106A25AA|nr:alpha-1,3-mannosyl-glycoprotein 4-beta-N-acetylglucosaminyltransferase C-like [Dendronephthya gigantea]